MVMTEAQEDHLQQDRSLEVWAQNLYAITYAVLCWPKQVTGNPAARNGE